MDSADAEHDLLAHFDRSFAQETTRELPTRGVGWVLKWAAALATLGIAAVVLVEFGYCLAAEHTLTRAARACVLEATLPRATHQSVERLLERRLTIYSLQSGRVQFCLQQNGAPVRGALRVHDGDRLSVALAVPTDVVLPDWLRRFIFWRDRGQITVRAERQMPKREFMLGAGLPTSPKRATEGLQPR